MPFSDPQLEEFYPWIPWREPWTVTHRQTQVDRFLCRFCIGQYGFKPSSDDHNEVMYRTFDECVAHIEMFHPRKEGDNAERESNG